MDEPLAAAVEDYQLRHRRKHARELDYFRLPRLRDDEAVSVAALCQLPSGKRHPHQRRIPRTALNESRQRLLMNLDAIRACSSFDELYELVEQLIRPIPMIGELTVYDTSLRIGAHFRLEPELVYLHAGTRVGARRLGLNWRARALDVDSLPPAVRVLAAHEIEDVLCIYEDWFRPQCRSSSPVLLAETNKASVL
jgi:hypothetical protein